jgi:hypothetical protein
MAPTRLRLHRAADLVLVATLGQGRSTFLEVEDFRTCAGGNAAFPESDRYPVVAESFIGVRFGRPFGGLAFTATSFGKKHD